MDRKFRDSIILIGPCGTGKSTLSRHLAAKLGYEIECFDAMKEYFYKQLGYANQGWDFNTDEGIERWLEYQQQFDATIVKKTLNEAMRPKIFDMGATHTHYEEGFYKMAVASELGRYKNVVYLVPAEIVGDRATQWKHLNYILNNDNSYEPYATHTFKCDIFSRGEEGVYLNPVKVDALAERIIKECNIRQACMDDEEDEMYRM